MAASRYGRARSHSGPGLQAGGPADAFALHLMSLWPHRAKWRLSFPFVHSPCGSQPPGFQHRMPAPQDPLLLPRELGRPTGHGSLEIFRGRWLLRCEGPSSLLFRPLEPSLQVCCPSPCGERMKNLAPAPFSWTWLCPSLHTLGGEAGGIGGQAAPVVQARAPHT